MCVSTVLIGEVLALLLVALLYKTTQLIVYFVYGPLTIWLLLTSTQMGAKSVP